MKIRNLAAVAAAASLAVAPAVAAERPVAPIEGESEVGGGASLIIGLLAAAAFIAALYIALDDDEDPVSP